VSEVHNKAASTAARFRRMSIENPYAYRSAESPSCGTVAPRRFSYCRLLLVVPVVGVIALLAVHYYHSANIATSVTGKEHNLRKSRPVLRGDNTEARLDQQEQLATIVLTVKPTTKPTVTITESPTAFPTASPTVLPTYMPTLVPTSPPTAAPTMAPTTGETDLPLQVITQQPTQYPTFPHPSAQPTMAPTTDSRHKVVWLSADTGVGYTVPTGDLRPPVSASINCWSSISHLDSQSADFLQSVLYHKTTNLEQSLLATPIPFSDRLNFVPASFCRSELRSPVFLPAHTLNSPALELPTMTFPCGYSWQMMPQESIDETKIAFRTFFFVFFLSSTPLSPPSSVHHICYFIDHRTWQEPFKLCFFDKQLSLQTAENDYLLTTVPVDRSNEDNYVIASYRLSFDDESKKINAVEILVSGMERYSMILPLANNGSPDSMLGMAPSDNSVEFTCTDGNPLYCSTHFLLSEVTVAPGSTN
jgi:hypothetical protein